MRRKSESFKTYPRCRRGQSSAARRRSSSGGRIGLDHDLGSDARSCHRVGQRRGSPVSVEKVSEGVTVFDISAKSSRSAHG